MNPLPLASGLVTSFKKAFLVSRFFFRYLYSLSVPSFYCIFYTKFFNSTTNHFGVRTVRGDARRKRIGLNYSHWRGSYQG